MVTISNRDAEALAALPDILRKKELSLRDENRLRLGMLALKRLHRKLNG